MFWTEENGYLLYRRSWSTVRVLDVRKEEAVLIFTGGAWPPFPAKM